LAISNENKKNNKLKINPSTAISKKLAKKILLISAKFPLLLSFAIKCASATVIPPVTNTTAKAYTG
jgi:hypothetical protein